MAQKKRRASSDSETRLRSAAVELFGTKGYAATGIRDIARAAGVTSASLYHYASNKEALLAGIMQEGQQQLNEEATRHLQDANRPEDRIAALVSGLTMSHAANPSASRVIDSEIRSLQLGSPQRQAVVELRDAYEHMWTQALADGQTEGVFDITEPRIARLGLLNMCMGMHSWYRTSGELSAVEMAGTFVDLALGMVRASRGGHPIRSDDVKPIDPATVRRLPFEPIS
ncbi:TetR/AcrR family transcriptional regulator [Microbacterium sp. AGC85]